METMFDQIHHTSINVSNMERSLRFYRDILGLKVVLPPQEESGAEVERAVNVPSARIRYMMLKSADGLSQVELVQYLNPIGRPNDRANCDIGSMHLAFRVKDIDKAYEELKKRGVEFNSPPVKAPSGKGGFVYFLDPDGLTLELMED